MNRKITTLGMLMSRPSTLIDEKQRLAALDVGQSLIVEAPAGSGKTTLLTQRYLRLLSLAESPESIVAVTFSRKAAEEMRARIVNALNAINDSPQHDDTSDVQHGPTGLDPVTEQWAREAHKNATSRNWALELNPRRLRILTIDALAHLIVRRHPLSAGGTSAQQVMEDPSNLYTLAARGAIEEIATGSEWSQAVDKVAAHFDNNWSRLERLLAGMLGVREQWLAPVTSNPERADLEGVLARVVGAALVEPKNALSRLNVEELIRVCRFAGENVASTKPQSDICCLKGMTSLPAASPDALPQWRALAELFLTRDGAGPPRKTLNKNQGFPASDAESKLLKQIALNMIADCEDDEGSAKSPARISPFQHLQAVSHLPEVQFVDATWQTLDALFTVLKLAAAHLRLIFQQTGMVDFTEISLSALTALGQEDMPSDASLLLDYQISHLLVDEFQDTSVVQYQLIERLIGGWEPHDGRTLFLVGDPMQSIYRFRQADVSRFTDTFAEQKFSHVPLQAVRLAANFRSDPKVINWINEALVKISNADARFPETTSLSAVRDPGDNAEVKVHGLCADESVGAKVVGLVNQVRLVDKSQSIAILVRNRSHLDDITSQLREANIAVAATDIDQLLEQPIVGDMVALTRALVHPADTTAWLAVLRAPWLALNLVELSHVSLLASQKKPSRIGPGEIGQGEIGPDKIGSNEIGMNHTEAGQDAINPDRVNPDKRLMFDALIEAEQLKKLPASTRARLEMFNQVFGVAMACVGRMPLTEIVAAAWHALRGTELAKLDKAFHYAERYLQLLEEFERRENHITGESLKRFLARRFVSPAGVGGEAVHVMTIHKAKGLEFDTVILPGLNRGTMGDPKPPLLWQETQDQELLMSLLPAEGKKDRLYDFLRMRGKEAADAERFRLLYVALTRAKHQLHLIGENFAEDGEPKKGSMQEILWPEVSSSLTLVADEAVAQTPDVEDSSLDTTLVDQDSPTQESISGPLLRRMSDDILFERMKRYSDVSAALNPRAEVEFLWASSHAKYTGTVIHDLLCMLGARGVEKFSSDWQAHRTTMVTNRLLAIGIDRALMTEVIEKVGQAIDAVLGSERGQWLFAATHSQAFSELPLTAMINQQAVNVILDRVFVTEDGVRWIVDFKTGEHRGADVDAFLDSEVERYRPQLARYAEVYQTIEPRPTVVALYFPLLDAWREWRYEG